MILQETFHPALAMAALTFVVWCRLYYVRIGEMYRRVMRDRRPESIEHFHVFDDGREVWFEVRAFPVEEGLAAFFRDITRHRAQIEQAGEAAERIQLALDAGAIVGTWVWQVAEDRITGDERFAQLFGLDEAACRAGLPLGVAFLATIGWLLVRGFPVTGTWTRVGIQPAETG